MPFQTTDLSDEYADVQVLSPGYRDFGGLDRFAGPISTIKCHEDNTLVRAALEAPGEGKVLVVDGGGSMRCALLGDMLAALGVENGWRGVLVHGCVRDTEVLAKTTIGIKALDSHPRKSVKRGVGERDVVVRFGDVMFEPGAWLYADPDGVLVAESRLD